MFPKGVNRTTFASCLGTVGVLGERYLGQHPSCKCCYLSTHPPTSKPLRTIHLLRMESWFRPSKKSGSPPRPSTCIIYTVESESESEVAQSCPTLCDPVDCSLPDSSVHEILQARILEWVAISFSRESS